MQFSASRRTFGFTLSDLLVVVGVLGIMAVAMWPIFAREREKSRRSSCEMNLKKIAVGIAQYKNDHDEYFPLIFVTNAPGPKPPYGWADAIQPYVKSTAVYQCPSDTNAASFSPNQNGYTDYWFNANLWVNFTRNGKLIFKSGDTHWLGSDAQTVLVGEGGNADASGGHDARYNQCGDGSSLSQRNQVCAMAKSLTATYPAAQIHLGGANFVFADGHIKWIKGDAPTQSAMLLSNRAGYSNIKGRRTFSRIDQP